MYCDKHMSYAEVWTPPDMGSCGYAGTAHYIYMCESCKHQEDIDIETGEMTYSSFRVGLYWLQFNHKYNSFKLGEDPPDDIGNTDTILRLNFLPTHLTPQNTTEERIKLYLLFS